jgi:5-formyltetrahydrofolate cyclo-ligase
MTKEELRKEFIKRRLSITSHEVVRMGANIASALRGSKVYSGSKILSLYFPVKGEVPTEEIFQYARKNGKIVVFPRIKGRSIEFSPVNDLRDMRKGAFGIPEPSSTSVCSLSEIDLLLVPGVAFDRCGNRLGYGKGYFDSVLRRSPRPVSIGLSYECQIYDGLLPTGPGDARVDMVLTEIRLIEVRKTCKD